MRTIPPYRACPCEQHSTLQISQDGLHCLACGQYFETVDGVLDLLMGERFDDEQCDCMWSNEEVTGRFLSQNYLDPLLKHLFDNRLDNALRILSIGCGVGSDVEALNELGYEACGVDAGSRAKYWMRRQWPDRYYLANGKHLPFADESFDVVLMGCVIPHIGVVGDTQTTTLDYLEQRQRAAREMRRVVKKGGYMLISSPNRLCPLDFFHRSRHDAHMPRLHSRQEPFLLSVDDYAMLLREDGDCQHIKVLPLRGYWGFFSSSRYLLGRILQLPVRFYFNQFMSWQWTSKLRSTGLNPWLILLVQR